MVGNAEFHTSAAGIARFQDRAKGASPHPEHHPIHEMTDLQVFTFLVMPFLFVLTCSMVFFSSRTMKSKKPADPPVPVTRPNSYTRKSRKRSLSAK